MIIANISFLLQRKRHLSSLHYTLFLGMCSSGFIPSLSPLFKHCQLFPLERNKSTMMKNKLSFPLHALLWESPTSLFSHRKISCAVFASSSHTSITKPYNLLIHHKYTSHLTLVLLTGRAYFRLFLPGSSEAEAHSCLSSSIAELSGLHISHSTLLSAIQR